MTLSKSIHGAARMTRRDVLVGAVGAAIGAGASSAALPSILRTPDPLAHAEAAALPEAGMATGIRFGESVARLVEAEALSPRKLEAIYRRRGGMPQWVRDAITGNGGEIHLSADRAPYLLHLLWPLGLANHTSFNADTPVAEGNVDRFAATGGWTIGAAETGGRYFNSTEAVALDGAQEALVERLARGIFRPCCNNSTLFQDCNHGSALLGLLELGAAQGLSQERLLRVALAAQAYWYPTPMTELALYMNELGPQDFRSADPAMLLSARYFSVSGWRANVHQPLANARLLPRVGGGGGSGGSV